MQHIHFIELALLDIFHHESVLLPEEVAIGGLHNGLCKSGRQLVLHRLVVDDFALFFGSMHC
jgi:hypothetical protein